MSQGLRERGTARVDAFAARPIIVAIAGPNGAGKSTFYEAFLGQTGLRFINADDIARLAKLEPYAAAELAAQFRHELIEQGESFIFETVFSDPVGAKLDFLQAAAARGYAVVLCFIGLASHELSDERVAMRVLQGGHDVPPHKIAPRYARSLANLRRAISVLPRVLIYDNSDLARPYRKVAEYEQGVLRMEGSPVPLWLGALR